MNMAETLSFQGLRGTLRLDEPMARHSSWRAGGRAARLYLPADLEDLAAFLRQLPAGEPLLFVGLGSNLLVRDGGLRGTVVLTHAAAKRPEMLLGRVYAEAGVASPKVARFAALNNLAGAEFLAGIPGSVGGALAMNAGCYGSETWDIVARAVTIDRKGELRSRERDQFEISYRHCALREGGQLGQDEWFVAAYFQLAEGDGEASRATVKEFLSRRVASQPLQLPNAGSVFRNPIADHAARLIEACGLKGLERGGARVSEKHANFIVNLKGAAKAADIEWLIATVRARVLDQTGIDLQPEVRIVGEAA
ncbi:MAG TPA: UDP-N-acetylmuramate dehydrogenase [Burkholderiales bacterium]|nr:UDP-N-acetylmuramate dehydrogenase [Burkholderiales bacterium]